MEMERVLPVFERPEEIGNVGMFHRHARVIGDQILFAHIGDIVALIILGEQMIEGLIPGRAAVFGNGIIPFLGVRELRVDIKDNTAKGMFLVPLIMLLQIDQQLKT